MRNGRCSKIRVVQIWRLMFILTCCWIFKINYFKVCGPNVVPFVIAVLHLSEIWPSLELRMETEKTHVTMTLDYALKIISTSRFNFEHNCKDLPITKRESKTFLLPPMTFAPRFQLPSWNWQGNLRDSQLLTRFDNSQYDPTADFDCEVKVSTVPQ